ncbi:MAG TPA: hypothetical protein VGC45_13170 [Gryllotalpicola sp.]
MTTPQPYSTAPIAIATAATGSKDQVSRNAGMDGVTMLLSSRYQHGPASYPLAGGGPGHAD